MISSGWRSRAALRARSMARRTPMQKPAVFATLTFMHLLAFRLRRSLTQCSEEIPGDLKHPRARTAPGQCCPKLAAARKPPTVPDDEGACPHEQRATGPTFLEEVQVIEHHVQPLAR